MTKLHMFESTRREVVRLQGELTRRERDFQELQRQTISDHYYMPLHGQYNEIVNIEREIIRLRQKMPPYAIDKGDGIVDLLPVTTPINPREAV